jgi:hypothetical protein
VSARPADTASKTITKTVTVRQHRHCQAEAGRPQRSLDSERQERAPGLAEARSHGVEGHHEGCGGSVA